MTTFLVFIAAVWLTTAVLVLALCFMADEDRDEDTELYCDEQRARATLYPRRPTC